MDKSSFLLNCKTSEEKLLFSRLFDQYNAAVKTSGAVFSDFIDPMSLSKCVQMFEKNMPRHLKVLVFGGAESCERKMICFSTDEEEQFPITCLEIIYNKKFSKELSHRDFLGSILALGIERRKIGDIIVSDFGAYVFVESGISGYILHNLSRVGKTPVSVKKAEKAAEGAPSHEREARVTVASLRLDAVIAACFRLSRGKASSIVASEKVFINWRLEENPSKPIAEGEVVTVRGYGRLIIKEIIGKSKKDKIILRIMTTT